MCSQQRRPRNEFLGHTRSRLDCSISIPPRSCLLLSALRLSLFLSLASTQSVHATLIVSPAAASRSRPRSSTGSVEGQGKRQQAGDRGAPLRLCRLGTGAALLPVQVGRRGAFSSIQELHRHRRKRETEKQQQRRQFARSIPFSIDDARSQRPRPLVKHPRPRPQNNRPSPMLRARCPARPPSAGPTRTRARGTSVRTRVSAKGERKSDEGNGEAEGPGGGASPSALPSRRSALLSATAAAALFSATASATTALLPLPAQALLTSPNARLPRSPEAALRRSVPAVNPAVSAARASLESVQFRLRIPQRKPWDAMLSDVEAAAAILGDKSKALELTPPDAVVEAEAAAAAAVAGCARVKGAIDARDADVTAKRLNLVLADVANLQLLQAPGLAYELPREFASLPRLAGRAVVELDIEKRGSRRGVGGQNSAAAEGFDLRDGRVSKRATLELTLDGYAAPLTAGNFLQNVIKGAYDGTPLGVSPTAILAGLGARGVSSEATLPLEILPAGAFEPLYRSPLDVAGGELPLLPLSVYGSLAASRPAGAPPSEASASEFFVFLYSRQQAGLGGLAFEEGEFSVFGYATGPGAAVLLPQISQEDVIVRTRVISGKERLVVPRKSGGGGGEGAEE